MNAARYPRIFHVLPFLPLAWIVYANWIPIGQLLFQPQIVRIVYGVMLLCLVATYAYQTRYLTRQLGKPIKGQLILLGIGTLVPTLATVAGDTMGGLHFGDTATPSAIGGIEIPLLLLFGAGAMIWLCAMGNVFYIKGSKSPNQALKVLNIIATVLVSIAIAIAAYYAFAFAYSARDPSAE